MRTDFLPGGGGREGEEGWGRRGGGETADKWNRLRIDFRKKEKE